MRRCFKVQYYCILISASDRRSGKRLQTETNFATTIRIQYVPDNICLRAGHKRAFVLIEGLHLHHDICHIDAFWTLQIPDIHVQHYLFTKNKNTSIPREEQTILNV